MDVFASRKYLFIAGVVLVSLVLIARLFYIQVMEDTYQQFAEDNYLQKKIVYPTRGLIYDRNRNILVANKTVYDVMVTPSKVKDIDTALFCDIVDISREQYEQRMKEAKRYSYYRASVFLKQLSQKRYAKLQERNFSFTGFYARPRTIRTYPYGVAPHTLGYMGEITRQQLSEKGNYYSLGDYIGISGLEKQYESILRGQKGSKYVVVDALNRQQGSYLDGKLNVPAKPGNDIITTLDLDLQRYGERLMKGKIGSIVALEPESGEVLAMVSSPSYNPNRLVGRQRASNFQKLAQNTNQPLFNRTITATYPPGSTFKPLMAILGLQDTVLRPSTRIPCNNGTYVSGLRVGCHAHKAPADLRASIVYSCNSYYVHTFKRFLEQDRFSSLQAGYNQWYDYIQDFGFGKKLGIDLPTERSGSLPKATYYNEVYGEGRWGASTIISLGIGQGEMSTTTLQLANAAAIMANRGYYVTPHLVDSVMKNGKRVQQPYTKHVLPFDSASVQPVVEGMRGVVEEGTARYYGQVPGVEVSGKTGTAENPHGDDHSLFIAFAPSKDPEIAVATIIENSGYGSVWAAPTNTLMIEQYLTDTIKRKWIEKKMLKANFIKESDTTAEETTTPDTEETPTSITPEDTLDYSDVQNDDTTTNTR
jgi:penicillin-binding protein 2